MSTGTRNLHVPLPSDVYESLRKEAQRLGRPTTQVARDAILQLLVSKRREAVAQALTAYAREAGGTTDDLDPALEQAGVECLMQPEKRVRKRAR